MSNRKIDSGINKRSGWVAQCETGLSKNWVSKAFSRQQTFPILEEKGTDKFNVFLK